MSRQSSRNYFGSGLCFGRGRFGHLFGGGAFGSDGGIAGNIEDVGCGRGGFSGSVMPPLVDVNRPRAKVEVSRV